MAENIKDIYSLYKGYIFNDATTKITLNIRHNCLHKIENIYVDENKKKYCLKLQRRTGLPDYCIANIRNFIKQMYGTGWEQVSVDELIEA